MTRTVKLFMVAILLSSVFIPLSAPVDAASKTKKETLMFILNTRQYYKDGSVYLAQAPHLVHDGVTYVSMRSLAERIGYTVTYDSSTKEYSMSKGKHTLSFKLKGKTYRYNGEVRSIRSGEIHTDNGSLMIPLREAVTPLGMSVVPLLKDGKVEISWTESSGDQNPNKPTPVPLQVGITTDKEEYKIGEDITYNEHIRGGSGRIKSKKWTNDEPVYFTPGMKTVTLEITDENGEVARAETTFRVTDEVLRTKEQYDALTLDYGEKMPIDGDAVLGYREVEYEIDEEDYTLIRSNSPEQIYNEGIYYEDSVAGDVRFLIHKQNKRLLPAKAYLVATNKNDKTATVDVNRLGIGGPNKYVATNAKQSLSNYYHSLSGSVKESVSLAPNETAIIAESDISKPIPTDYSLTVYADLHSNEEIQYQVIVLDMMNDFERVYPFLRGVSPSRDGRHTRGTFEKGNRTIVIEERLGEESERIAIGDGKMDTYVTGYDHLSDDTPETNFGNRGVFYTMELENVAPQTALVLNPRGGSYIGAFLINGKVVTTPNAGTIAAKNEAAVLYRTGNREEKVTIQFIPASGSNLPLNLVTIPLEQ